MFAEVATACIIPFKKPVSETSGGTSFCFSRSCSVTRSTGFASLNSSRMAENMMPYCRW